MHECAYKQRYLHANNLFCQLIHRHTQAIERKEISFTDAEEFFFPFYVICLYVFLCRNLRCDDKWYRLPSRIPSFQGVNWFFFFSFVRASVRPFFDLHSSHSVSLVICTNNNSILVRGIIMIYINSLFPFSFCGLSKSLSRMKSSTGFEYSN